MGRLFASPAHPPFFAEKIRIILLIYKMRKFWIWVGFEKHYLLSLSLISFQNL